MKLSEVLGQKKVVAVLKERLRQNKFPNAFLFAGLTGVGKARTAQAFASSLLCENRKDSDDACGECPSCRKMAKGSHPSWINVLPDEDAIKIEQIRELLKRISFKPLEGSWTIVFIDEAEKLTTSAANSLLKTLEEPTASLLFILSTSATSSLLSTITSRCQTLNFAPLPESLVSERLKKDLEVSPELSSIIAELAGGSLGQALESDLEFLSKFRQELFTFLEHVGQASSEAKLDWAARIAQDKEHLQETLRLIKSWYRDIFVFATTRNREQIIHKDWEASFHDKREMDPSVVSMALKRLNLIDQALEGNVNKQLALESLLLNLP